MSPAVASVRQNLQTLVDHGDVNPACAIGGTHYHLRRGGAPQGDRLFPDASPPQHYLAAASSRDFYTWSTRQQPAAVSPLPRAENVDAAGIHGAAPEQVAERPRRC
jgi:hypothetical protein